MPGFTFMSQLFWSAIRNTLGRKYSKMDKRAKDKLVRSPGENGRG